MTDQNVGKVLYDYDIKKIPLYKSQESYWSDIEFIDSFCRTPTIPESQDVTTQPNCPLPDSTPKPLTPEVVEVSIIASMRRRH